MRGGALRHQVTITQPTHANTNGEIATTWGTVTVCWASLEPLKGREWIESGLENSEITSRMRMRYLSGIGPTMRVNFGARTFEIVSVVDVYERTRELEVMLKELVEV